MFLARSCSCYYCYRYVFHVSIVWTCVPERFLMKFHYATYIDIDTSSFRFRVRLGSRISDLRSSSLNASYIWVLVCFRAIPLLVY